MAPFNAGTGVKDGATNVIGNAEDGLGDASLAAALHAEDENPDHMPGGVHYEQRSG